MGSFLIEGRKLTFGLILPHFGEHLGTARLLRFAREAEAHRFSSLWARDRMRAGAGHGLIMEGNRTTFLEAVVSLAAVATHTTTIKLGTAVLAPTVHPLRLAQQLGSLAYIAGDRIILGLGAGAVAVDFNALGLPFAKRTALFEETLAILRRSERPPIQFEGKHFRIEAPITIDPAPPLDMPIWYGGTSEFALRRAWKFCDGWIAGRLPIRDFEVRMRLLDELRTGGDHPFEIATIPITLLGPREAVRREVMPTIPLLGESSETAKTWIRPPSGRFDTIEDLSGLLIAGDSDDCYVELCKLARVGIDHVVFDFRLAFDRSFEMIAQLEEEVFSRLPYVDG